MKPQHCLIGLLFLSLIGCVSPAVLTKVPPLTETITWTALPPTQTTELRTATSTATAATTATRQPTTDLTPTLTITLSTWRETPAALMMHESTPEFDAVAYLDDLLDLLAEREFHVVTYQQINTQPDITALEQGNLFILTIDDINLQAPIDESIQEMIALIEEAGYPAVLGVVTEGALPNEETASELSRLSDKGWEIAAHTDHHVNLREMEDDTTALRMEIRNCQDKIEAVTGIRPITLILPEGQMVDDAKPFYKEGVVWAVGITDGERYKMTDRVKYVGRSGPSEDAASSLQSIIERFDNGLTVSAK